METVLQIGPKMPGYFFAWLLDFVVDRANKDPALADTISSMFTDLDLRERLKRPGFYMDLFLGRSAK